MYIHYHFKGSVRFFKYLIQQGHFKSIKSDSKDIYDVIKVQMNTILFLKET